VEDRVIFDSHTHVMSRDEVRYPPDLAVPEAPSDDPAGWPKRALVTAEDLSRDMVSAGVDRAVLVQGWSAYQYDNRYVIDAARADPGRFAAVCAVDPLAPGPAEVAATLAAQPEVGGLRIMAGFADSVEPLVGPGARLVWETAGEHALAVVTLVRPYQITALAATASSHRDVPVVVDHCAFVDVANDLMALDPLIDLENVSFVASTAVLRQASNASEVMRTLVDAVGAHRLMWGSIHPAVQGHDYEALVGLAREAADALTRDETALFLHDTAAALWPRRVPGGG
jgi:predicted TIM-barrel fold metal-dependent hydrolase